MHIELDPAALQDFQKPSRKGKERDLLHRDSSRDPQPTDLDDRLIALRRRNAACAPFPALRRCAYRFPSAIKPRDRPERPAQPERSPKPAPQPSSKPLQSPRRANMSPQVVVSRPPQEADPDDFSRRLKISSSPSPRLAQQSAKQAQKLFDPERDPIPTLRRTAEPEQMQDATSSRSGPTRDAAARQLFNHRKDDPVRFSVLARPQGRPTPTPKHSGDYVSASSASSYAASQTSSSFTLSSTTDGSSASSALFEGQRKSAEDPGNNVFAVQLKKLYRTITSLESKINQEDSDETDDTSRVMLKGKEQEDEETQIEKWKRRLEDHKRSVVFKQRVFHILISITVSLKTAITSSRFHWHPVYQPLSEIFPPNTTSSYGSGHTAFTSCWNRSDVHLSPLPWPSSIFKTLSTMLTHFTLASWRSRILLPSRVAGLKLSGISLVIGWLSPLWLLVTPAVVDPSPLRTYPKFSWSPARRHSCPPRFPRQNRSVTPLPRASMTRRPPALAWLRRGYLRSSLKRNNGVTLQEIGTVPV